MSYYPSAYYYPYYSRYQLTQFIDLTHHIFPHVHLYISNHNSDDHGLRQISLHRAWEGPGLRLTLPQRMLFEDQEWKQRLLFQGLPQRAPSGDRVLRLRLRLKMRSEGRELRLILRCREGPMNSIIEGSESKLILIGSWRGIDWFCRFCLYL